MAIITIKSKSFFDAKGVAKAVQKAKMAPLARMALEVEFEAKASMQPGGGKGGSVSSPGEAPRVQTGNLRSSIVTSRLPGTDIFVVGPTRIAFYGKFLEFGTRSMSPRPFMRPALAKVSKRAGRHFSRIRLRRFYTPRKRR